MAKERPRENERPDNLPERRRPKSLPERRAARRRSRGGPAARVLRNPDLLLYWEERNLLVKDLASGVKVSATADVIAVLDFFSRPRRVGAAASALEKYEPRSVTRAVQKLIRIGLLLPEKEARLRRSRLKAWKSNLASAQYHSACRDTVYLERPEELRTYYRQVASTPRPPRFKRYPSRFRRPLSVARTEELSSLALGSALKKRRTVRNFSASAVDFDDLAVVVGGTWGRTGWIDGEALGRLAAKTSPSAGALHPIECYLLAWNVQDLPPGLYHYDVAADELRRLRSGDFRVAAVRAASGQSWIGGAGFLCVMTACFSRTLWKYPFEVTYRTLWLDAGHLAQTFSLLATARGLGPFTTAAIQDSFIENLIGLDGVTEFPVYLCGAGVPKGTNPQGTGARLVRIM